MATHVTQRELSNDPDGVLARVERGEELTITVRGRPVADLIPTREQPRRRPTSWAAFADGLQGMLTDDETFERDVREGLEGPAEDPFERW